MARAHTPGNGFAFLMTAVSTGHTEIMSLHEISKSWEIVLFFLLVTVSQVILFSWVMSLSGAR